jgi:hypothetical protein
MVVSLLIDWGQLYVFDSSHTMPVIVNKGFITTLFCSASAACAFLLLRKEADTFYLPGITNAFVRKACVIISIALLFASGLLEINYQFVQRYPGLNLNYLYLQLYTITFFTGLFIIAERIKAGIEQFVKATIIVVLFILYLINASNIYSIEVNLMLSGQYNIHFVAQMFGVIAIAAMIIHALRHCIRHKNELGTTFHSLITTIAIACVIVLSIELRNAYIWSTFSKEADIAYYENLYSKAFLSIIWGVSSFAMVWLGMRYRIKTLRVTALFLFGLTLLKLFTFDIKNIPPAGKIAAFILLGVLLLTVSFMYQRLKKLLLDAPEK